MSISSGVLAFDETYKQQSYESATNDQTDPSCQTTSQFAQHLVFNILWCKLKYLVVQVVKPTLTLPKEFSFATGRPAMKPPTGVGELAPFFF